MSRTSYTRLSALDAAFLEIETPNAHMHVGAVTIFDAAPLRDENGKLDVVRIERLIEHTFRRFPRYRQKLAWIPVFHHPVWVDDERFNLHYHVRHTALPSPGEERQLKRLAGRILSQQLDRGKPLWEMWIVEGLENDRFAIISKAHHCMIDGVGGVELIGTVMGPSPRDVDLAEDRAPWRPRPQPSPRQLFRDEVARLAAEPVALAKGALSAVQSPRSTAKAARDAAVGIAQALSSGLRAASDTPLNVDIGPHRKFDWTSLELAKIKEIRSELGGTLNDVVLTIAAGALGRFLAQRGVDLRDIDFRAMVPVNTRSSDERTALGNRVTMMVARLPVDEADVQKRLDAVHAEMARHKESHEASGVRVLENLSDATVHGLFATFAQMAGRARAYNVVVTNVPGPPFEAYLLRAPMRAVYPLVPLFSNQALGIAVFTYNGSLYWGFNADFDEVPDLHELAVAVQAEFEALRVAAAAHGKRPHEVAHTSAA
jgi:WS/DGAT/MGAT family acyltransferase